MNKKRVVAFIDGFNLYHSVHELGTEYRHLKWLNVYSLTKALIHPNRDELNEVLYFTSIAHWNEPEKRKRHDDYIAATQASGAVAIVGSFKKVNRKCSKCNKTYKAFEENGTDVAIAAKIVDYAARNLFDKALLFSADSDLTPVVSQVLAAHPDKEIYIVTTSSRIRNAKGLRGQSSGFISIDAENFAKNLLPESINCDDRVIEIPETYKRLA